MRAMIAVVGFSLAPILPAAAQAPVAVRPIRPLTKEDLPPAPAREKYAAIVKDSATLLALGKALFWDVQVGAANGQACASCHYHAGVDTRTINQLSPGLKVVVPGPDSTFGDAANHRTHSGAAAGPNLQLVPFDFPFHRVANPTDRESPVVYDTNDVVSSQGAFQGGPLTDGEKDPVGLRTRCSTTLSPIFAITVGGTPVNTRKVERRNTSPNVNTAFNVRNLWDGRANNVFNGVDPFGPRTFADPAARVWVTDGASVQPVLLQLENMSAASQAVGPVLNSFETTCEGKVFADIGRRLMQQRALKDQAVAADDSVFSRTPGLSIMPASAGGLKANYRGDRRKIGGRNVKAPRVKAVHGRHTKQPA